MGNVGQKALLAAEQAIQPFQCLVEGPRQIADLVSAVAMGHAPAQVVGAGDLASDGGDIPQWAEQGRRQGGHYNERNGGRAQRKQQGPAEHAIENLKIIEKPGHLDMADELPAVVKHGNRQDTQQCIIARHQAINLFRSQAFRVQHVVKAGQVARLDDDLSRAIDDDNERRGGLQRRQVIGQRLTDDAVVPYLDVAGHQLGGKRVEIAVYLGQ